MVRADINGVVGAAVCDRFLPLGADYDVVELLLVAFRTGKGFVARLSVFKV